MNDVEEGGQTAFVNSEAPDPSLLTPLAAAMTNSFLSPEVGEALSTQLNLKDLEADMVKQCYSKLSVRPRKVLWCHAVPVAGLACLLWFVYARVMLCFSITKSRTGSWMKCLCMVVAPCSKVAPG